jgi:hypothetical protein
LLYFLLSRFFFLACNALVFEILRGVALISS